MHERAFKYFLAVTKVGSIRKAADQLNVAASAVSRHISDLEFHYKTPLLERLARGVVPTEAGLIVAEHAQRALENVETLDDRLRNLRGIHEGTVRICCGSGWMGDLMENGLAPFAKLYPNVSWHVLIGTTSTIQAAIASGEADIGLLYNPPSHEMIVSKCVSRQGVHALVARDSSYGSLPDECYLRDLAHVPAGLHTPAHGLRQLSGQIEANDRFRLNVKLETDSANLKLRFALAGVGMILGPLFSVAGEMHRLKKIRMLDPLLAQGNTHLIVRAERRLPEASAHLANFLGSNLQAFAADRGA